MYCMKEWNKIPLQVSSALFNITGSYSVFSPEMLTVLKPLYCRKLAILFVGNYGNLLFLSYFLNKAVYGQNCVEN